MARDLDQNRAAGHTLNLPIEHLNRRFRLDDKESDQHADQNNNPVVIQGGDHLSKVITGRHKAHIGACQKQHEADVGVDQADADAQKLPAV